MEKTTFLRLAFLAGVLAFLCSPCGGGGTMGSQNAKPNILLIVVDTLRADHLSCSGYDRKTTPAVDKLAEEGILFRRCYSTSSWTLPACASILTGLYPGTHGVNQWNSRIPDELPILPEILRKHGYYCAGVSSNPFLTAGQGFARGFDIFDDQTVIAAAEWGFPLLKSKYKAMVRASTGATTTRRAMELLNERPASTPFFLFVHYMDCHADYVPPPPYNKKFDNSYKGKITGEVQSKRFGVNIPQRDVSHVISLYDGEIAYTDSQIGELLRHLEALGCAQDTCVILTADHGEEFLEHGNWGHGRTLYEETVRVPLLFRWPGRFPPSKKNSSIVSLVDILPTVLDGLKIPAPKICHGLNLGGNAVLDGRNQERTVTIMTFLGDRLRGIVHGDSKLICSEEDDGEVRSAKFFDLKTDPAERANGTGGDSEGQAKLLKIYGDAAKRFAKDRQVLTATQPADGQRNPAQYERLKSLGYIGE